MIITLDLDHSIIRPANGNTFPVSYDDFELINEELYADASHQYVVVSNQAGIAAGYHTQTDIINRCKLVLQELPEQVKAIIFIPDFEGKRAIIVARGMLLEITGDGDFRKPSAGIINVIEEIFEDKVIAHCGDRDEDRHFAAAANIKFTLVK